MRITTSSPVRQWDTLRAADVAQWAGPGEAIVVMKTKDGGFVNLKTGEVVRKMVASGPWTPLNAELKVETL